MGDAADYVYEDDYVDDDYDDNGCLGRLVRININQNRKRYLCEKCHAVLSTKRFHHAYKNRTKVSVPQCYPEYRDLILSLYPDAEVSIVTEKEKEDYIEHLKTFRKKWRSGLTEDEYMTKVEKAASRDG